ncbi:MAG: ribbon-helix-helix protein, CopG family [Gammaproteobacteria bacterium]|nr:ribbon-helix-helix protein, CopG family [Gammaproteobacteria bacterium]
MTFEKIMSSFRVKFSTKIDSALLDEVRALAKEEGRQIQAIIEEALENLLEDRRQGKVRPRIMRVYRTSHARFSSLYRKFTS